MTIDQNLMEAADIIEYEQIKIYNVSNGARFDTYAIAGKPGSGEICLNGAAARMGARGDLVIIVTYGNYEKAELAHHQPKVVLVTAGNRIDHVKEGIS
jgi:aspartate 1-decarboxylase